ncbi:SDR family NAD(P)-dependent oxidoreductase [Cellulosimicrobium protaetiae]|uniref:SDR family NAD(P)-dependent oxidoreductase n=1 Tax=Cellulosimicrobium protaetiae TaxID=2587808 RepID=A0A6M5U9K0_9MICO|nr:SDR family NAD(P)-dependent oxidoreductase [Cellulosimicrobium protaetiae]QJW35156.1 SDR family NAD(P)-dependent oxidoreductase [Cellulosimicrobium protaetiae]
MDEKPTWFVTGAATGLGAALAEHALESGDRVVLAARSAHDLSGVRARFPDTALTVELDVVDAAQRQEAVAAAEAWAGGVDVLVNNAAIDFLGAIEEQDEADVRAQFEVNVFAPVALVRLVLPGMRARRRGTIVNVSSMDGIAALPANGYYSATKFALEGLTESLWQEIEPIGLRAFLVEPGSFRTGIEGRTHVSGRPIPDYDATVGAFVRTVSAVRPEQFPGDPRRAAEEIVRNVRAAEPRRRLVLGSDAYRRIGDRLARSTTELDTGRELAASTDFPGSGPAVL